MLSLSHAAVGALALLGTTLTSYVYVWETISRGLEHPPDHSPNNKSLTRARSGAVAGALFTAVILWFSSKRDRGAGNPVQRGTPGPPSPGSHRHGRPAHLRPPRHRRLDGCRRGRRLRPTVRDRDRPRQILTCSTQSCFDHLLQTEHEVSGCRRSASGRCPAGSSCAQRTSSEQRNEASAGEQ